MAISKHQIHTNIVFRAHARNHRNTNNTVHAIYEITAPPVLLWRGEQDGELRVMVEKAGAREMYDGALAKGRGSRI